MTCELIFSHDEYTIRHSVENGSVVQQHLGAVSRGEAMQEAIRQGFTEISIWEVIGEATYNRGTVTVPKQTYKHG